MKMKKGRKTEKNIKHKTNKNFMIRKYSKNKEKVKKKDIKNNWWIFVKVTPWKQVLFTSRGNLDLTSVSNNEPQSLQIFEKIKNALIITYITCVILPTTTDIPIISKLFIIIIITIIIITMIITITLILLIILI